MHKIGHIQSQKEDLQSQRWRCHLDLLAQVIPKAKAFFLVQSSIVETRCKVKGTSEIGTPCPWPISEEGVPCVLLPRLNPLVQTSENT